VQTLNDRAVVMSWVHLRRTRSVRVIAGGQSKLLALWTILLASRFDAQTYRTTREPATAPIVNELTTDRDTANVLLKAIRVLEADKELLRQYHDLCHVIGLSNSKPLS
jgi:hypothetical protein